MNESNRSLLFLQIGPSQSSIEKSNLSVNANANAKVNALDLDGCCSDDWFFTNHLNHRQMRSRPKNWHR